MVALGCVRLEDELPGPTAGSGEPHGGTLALDPVLGTWYATDHDAGGVVQMRLTSENGHLLIHVLGAGGPEPVDWGEVRATPYGARVTADTAMAFTAVFDFDFLTAALAAYVKQGILVLDVFTTFKDSSGRSDYFSREFFHR